MNKRIAELRKEMARTPAPDVSKSLSRRLKAMERQISTIARIGNGIGSAEVEHLGEELREMVGQARTVEESRPFMNQTVLDAHMRLHDAAGAIEGAMRDLRERLTAMEPDPTGSILASLQVGQSLLASAESILAGRMQS